MKLPREAWWLAGIVILMLIVGALLRGGGAQQAGQTTFSPTTYSSGPYGVRALHLTLQDLGYRVRRLRLPFAEATLPERATLVIIEPMIGVATREWEALYRWVAAGNTVLVTDSMLPQFEPTLADRGPLEEAPMTYARPIQPTYLAQGVRRLAVHADYRIALPVAPAADETEKLRRRLRTGAPEQERRQEMEQALSAAAPLFADKRGTVVAYARIGKGAAIVLSDAWALSNQGINKADNLEFALNALGPPGSRPVYFDEYHHGYGQVSLWTFTPTPVKVALGQLALAVLLAMYALGRRFGAVVPLERGRRQRSEFLGTMTALLRKGQATRLALRTAYDAATQRLRMELGLPPDVEAAEIARAATRIRPEVGEKLGAALRQCRGVLEGPETLTEARALALVRQLDEAVRAVRQI